MDCNHHLIRYLTYLFRHFPYWLGMPQNEPTQVQGLGFLASRDEGVGAFEGLVQFLQGTDHGRVLHLLQMRQLKHMTETVHTLTKCDALLNVLASCSHCRIDM